MGSALQLEDTFQTKRHIGGYTHIQPVTFQFDSLPSQRRAGSVSTAQIIRNQPGPNPASPDGMKEVLDTGKVENKRRTSRGVRGIVKNDSRAACFSRLATTICQTAYWDSLSVSFEYTPGRGGTPYRGDVSNCDKFAVSSCNELISTQIILSLHACSN